MNEGGAFSQAWQWLTTASSWQGENGIWNRIAEHLGYSALATVIAVVLGVSLGIAVGHTGRGRGAVLGASGVLRAMPTLGLLTFLALVIPSGITVALIPATTVLVLLAVPPVLAATAAGFEAVSRDAIDAATAMGFSTRQVICGVELPLALPVIIGGIRSAWLQVLATATVAAYLGLGGLGRYLLDALAVRNYGIMLAAAAIIAALSFLSDGVFALSERLLTPAGQRGKEAR
ncbi:ABC transporter permease [Corynebacterium amycolatum]|uniref:ABC transporter permease n=1 Tax=Corynebacterium amycolatum TaxID=43765 RepID=UPI003B5BDE26